MMTPGCNNNPHKVKSAVCGKDLQQRVRARVNGHSRNRVNRQTDGPGHYQLGSLGWAAVGVYTAKCAVNTHNHTHTPTHPPVAYILVCNLELDPHIICGGPKGETGWRPTESHWRETITREQGHTHIMYYCRLGSRGFGGRRTSGSLVYNKHTHTPSYYRVCLYKQRHQLKTETHRHTRYTVCNSDYLWVCLAALF
jgi:hypothetical protein